MKTTTRVILITSLFAIFIPYTFGINNVSEQTPKELTIAFPKRPYTINFLKEFSHIELNIHSSVYSSLLSSDPLTLEPTIGLAISWFLNEIKDEYTFNLRNNAKFSDGSLIVAQDVKDSWIAAIQEKNAFSYLFETIKGVKAYNNDAGSLQDIGITAVNDKVLKVTLENPSPQFLSIITHPAFSVSSSAQVLVKDWDEDPLSIDFTGPFVVSQSIEDKLVLTKNPYFWGEEFVFFDTINILFIDTKDQSAAIESLNRGEIQWITFYDSQTDALDDKKWLFVEPIFGSNYLFFKDTQSPPWNNPKVRTAIRLLLPLDKILSDLYPFPAKRLVPPLPGLYSVDTDISSQNVEKALTLLEEEGYPKGKGLGTITLFAPTYQDNTYDELFTLIKEELSSFLTNPIEIKTASASQYYDNIQEEEFTIASTNWIGDFPDPLAFLQIWNSPNKALGHNYDNPVYQALLTESQSSTKINREDYLKLAETLLIEDTVVIPIYHGYAVNVVRSDKLMGWTSNLLDLHPVGAMYFDTPKPLSRITQLPLLPHVFYKTQ